MQLEKFRIVGAAELKWSHVVVVLFGFFGAASTSEVVTRTRPDPGEIRVGVL